jgi:hypothetical protein
MNPAQRLFLRAAQVPGNFINNNLGKRSGMLGRIARFWAVGARDYGVHPSSKFLKLLNTHLVFSIKFFFARQSPNKTFFGRQNYVNGYFFLLRNMYPILGFTLLSLPFFVFDFFKYSRKQYITHWGLISSSAVGFL